MSRLASPSKTILAPDPPILKFKPYGGADFATVVAVVGPRLGR